MIVFGMAHFPAQFPRLRFTQGTSMAALTAISALATFFVLSQLHSTQAAPSRELPRQTAATATEETPPAQTTKAIPVVSDTRTAPPPASDPAPAKPSAP